MHEQRADVMIGHHLNGLENRIFRADGIHGPALAIEQMAHGDHGCRPPAAPMIHSS